METLTRIDPVNPWVSDKSGCCGVLRIVLHNRLLFRVASVDESIRIRLHTICDAFNQSAESFTITYRFKHTCHAMIHHSCLSLDF